jgi:GrpB-like predicted nucleotidyltransferase (UPF0157 family)
MNAPYQVAAWTYLFITFICTVSRSRFFKGVVVIAILPYRAEWPAEFRTLAATVREVLGSLAVRIDHIGSTSVPQLAAKDIIDIQVTAATLDRSIEERLTRAGYQWLEHIDHDHRPPGSPENEEEWKKWFFKGPANERPANLHVRLAGRANQRYPLLFRDYLRTHEAAAGAYAQVKIALSRYHPNDANAYYDIKDPVCDIIMDGAEAWARLVSWKPGPSDL